eukprot:s3317_g8.t1
MNTCSKMFVTEEAKSPGRPNIGAKSKNAAAAARRARDEALAEAAGEMPSDAEDSDLEVGTARNGLRMPISGVRRRISKKTSPSALSRSESSVSVPRTCHYDVLGVARNATEAEIKQAYRRLALQRHPDKLPGQLGRQPDASELHAATEASWRITQAFEILSDPDQRRKYDEAVGFGSSGRFKEDAPMPCQPRGEARELLHDMQVNGDCVRPSELPTAVLVELRSLLRAEQRVVSSSDAEVVKRSALRWRAALTVLRNRAKARMSLGGCRHTLIEDEVLTMLRADPDLNVVFSGAVYGTSKRTPKTQNWQLALTLQEQLLQVVNGGGNIESKVDKFMEKAKKTVEADKKKYKTQAAQQIREIDEELMRRQEQMVPHQSLAEALSLSDEKELEDALKTLQELAPAELRRRRTILFSPANSLDGWELL